MVNDLEEFTDYKIIIMNRIISDQELCKAIYYTDKDFLSKPEVDPSSLLYNNVFPHHIVPDETQLEAKTYVNLSFNRFRPIKGSFKNGIIYIHILCHHTLLRTSYNKIRYDYISNKIHRLMKGRGLGLGELEFYELGEYIVNNKFIGQYISYKPVGFN